ncbi:unnamed protein product [Blepharisma stoltei]|uniref:Uncharacterized protein n=1 Tax=Blepharisma stoltei TaxID=1481888 RepID=A0AAU9ILF8_9CILI|nr:unnamed protein product [Blepharisma stoltei]
MLPAIKEDTSANISVFIPKKKKTPKASNEKPKKQIRDFMAGQKIKIPKSLINYRKNKQRASSISPPKEFPTIDTVYERIRDFSESPRKYSTNSPQSMRTKSEFSLDNIDLLSFRNIKLINNSANSIELISRPQSQSKSSSPSKLSRRNHFRSNTPLQPFHDRITTLKRLLIPNYS